MSISHSPGTDSGLVRASSGVAGNSVDGDKASGATNEAMAVSSQGSGWLRHVWYMVAASHEVKVGQLLRVKVAGIPICLYRGQDGELGALRDFCPHRGIPLSFGQVLENTVECPYHGWRFDRSGTCVEIPSLCEGQNLDCRKIKVSHFQVREGQGCIWLFLADPARAGTPALPIFSEIPGLSVFSENRRPNLQSQMVFRCHIDHAVIGLMDPAHGPYVHRSWFWRSARSSYEKAKNFGPVAFGFRMLRHQPSSNSKAYKLLGGQPTTEITFQLPSVRTEHVKVGKYNFVALTALCPVDENTTIVHQMAYWDLPWLSLIKPFVAWFSNFFLNQDRVAVEKQQEGLKDHPPLMLIHDADTQAKWYFALKREWSQHFQEAREFRHPLAKETVLRWRS